MTGPTPADWAQILRLLLTTTAEVRGENTAQVMPGLLFSRWEKGPKDSQNGALDRPKMLEVYTALPSKQKSLEQSFRKDCCSPRSLPNPHSSWDLPRQL